jgi:pimeloyl-ACP methyl ester carboxylesterase
MIAHILRAVLLLQLAVGAAAGYGVWRAGGSWLWVVLAALAVPALIHLLFLLVDFALSSYANRGNPAARLGIVGFLRAWLAEWRVSMLIFHWCQPLRVNAVADSVHHQAQRGVVLVHGYFCNRAMWMGYMRQLQASGVPVVAITLEPAFGSIDHYALPVHLAVERLRRATGVRPLVVGHSMGGLAIRAYVAAYGSSAVERCITIGTPHHGTFHARFGHGTNARQMQQNSDWQQSNAQRLSTQDRARFICFYSNADNIVAPFESAMLEGAENRHVSGYGHMHLAFAVPVRQAILDEQSH